MLLGVHLLVPAAGYGYALNDKKFHIGGGVLSRNAGETATDARSTSKPFLNENYFNLSLMALFPINEVWSFSPSILYSVPFLGLSSKTSPEGNQKTSISGLNLRALYRVADKVDFHLGTGILYYKNESSGGVVNQNNGTGTSPFATPSGTTTSNLLNLNFGAAYFQDQWRVEGSLLVTNPMTAKKMALNPSVTLTMGFL